MFKRDHHVRIATVLQSLDADLLRQRRCYFGGGTAIVLLHDEYRESLDLDFLCSELSGYRELRLALAGQKDMEAIMRKGVLSPAAREIRADQYGIRTMLKVGSLEIKFEIVFEARLALEEPKKNRQLCGVSTLAPVDMAACKLLANSDRWADDSVYCRDLIDLAMLDIPSKLFLEALNKASEAYGESVSRDLKKAIARLKEHSERLDDCMDALKITDVPKALLWDRIRNLGKRLS